MLVLVRLASEINIKSAKIKASFLKRLMRNAKAALEPTGVPFNLRLEWNRLFVELGSDEALPRLASVFGIGSLSPVLFTTEPTLAAMATEAAAHYANALEGKTFCVRVKRSGLKGVTSTEIERELGAHLMPLARGVDLRKPEVKIEIELRPDGAYFLGPRIKGPGGLPLGVEGRALCLISGGFDSAYAAWLLMKRGVELDFVFFNLAGRSYERSVLAVIKALVDNWSHGYRPATFVTDFSGVVDAIREDVRPNYAQVVLKRVMYRTACRIAERLGDCPALVTGEAMGQVSSQTLHNLAAIEPASSLPVLRPLIGYDKEDIIAACRWIGTYILSETIDEYCAITPRHLITRGDPQRAAAEEAKVPPHVLEIALKETQKVLVHRLETQDLVADGFFVDAIGEDDVVIDCRERHHYDAWHYPGAENRSLEEMLTGYSRLDQARSYVLYCPFGLQTAVVAEKMQSAGYKAFSFRGGSQALRKYAAEQAVSEVTLDDW